MSPFLETTSLIVFGVWDFTPDPLCMYKSVATPLNPTEVQMGTCDCEMTLPDKCKVLQLGGNIYDFYMCIMHLKDCMESHP